jgi:hypothetical protein
MMEMPEDYFLKLFKSYAGKIKEAKDRADRK